MNQSFFSPAEAMASILQTSEKKLQLSLGSLLILGILAGAYIGLGAHLATTVTAGIADYVGFGLSKLISGVVFSLGLILVVIAGAELFTGNTMTILQVLRKKASPLHILFYWSVAYITNFIGALLVVFLIYWSGLNGDAEALTNVGANAIKIAEVKAALPVSQIFVRAILANWLVCLAIILATAARDISSKILAIIIPISAFVAMGFEHSIANMYFLPAGLLLVSPDATTLTVSHALTNIAASSLGNIVGAVVMVWSTYWFVYGRAADSAGVEKNALARFPLTLLPRVARQYIRR